jgi:hypothetical protein
MQIRFGHDGECQPADNRWPASIPAPDSGIRLIAWECLYSFPLANCAVKDFVNQRQANCSKTEKPGQTNCENGKNRMSTIALLLILCMFIALLIRPRTDGRAKPNGME